MEPVASGASTGDLGMAVARERPPESMTLSCCGCPVRPGGVGRCIRDCPGLSGASRGRCPPDSRASGFQCPRGARPAPARGTLTVRAATALSRPLGRGHAPPRFTDVETEFPAHSVAQPGLAPWLAPWLAAGGQAPPDAPAASRGDAPALTAGFRPSLSRVFLRRGPSMVGAAAELPSAQMHGPVGLRGQHRSDTWRG